MIAARSVARVGCVQDSRGVGIPGACVEVCPDDGYRRRFDSVLDYSTTERWTTVTDDDGEFRLPQTPHMSGLIATARHPSYCDGHTTLAEHAHDHVVIHLRRPEEIDTPISGLVIDADGGPVAGAQVSFGAQVTHSDTDGNFTLSRLMQLEQGRDWVRRALPPTRTLRAVKPGLLPAEVTVASLPSGEPAWPERVLLRLGGKAMSIEGRVVDRHGQGLPHRIVY